MFLKKSLKAIFLLIILSLFASSCSRLKVRNIDDSDAIFANFIYRGNWDSDTVIIYNQGGPEFYIEPAQFPYKPLLKAPSKTVKNALVVYMHQYQTKNRATFFSRHITFDEAKKFDEQTTLMLAKTVDYFKKRGKKVYLIGASFGAFVVQNYLAKYGSGKISGAIIAVGRLAMQEEFWKGFSRGEELFFKNGTQIIHDPSKKSHSSDPYSQANSLKLAAGLGRKNYINLLKDIDLSKTIYIYGENDSYVGRLTPDEVAFLKSKGVKMLKSTGGHQEAINEFAKSALLQVVK